MNTSADGWQKIAIYLAVARSGSLSAAARQLGISQPTVRRQIEALEQDLRTTLFTRSQSGLQPIDPSRTLLAHAEAMEAAAGAFARAAIDDTESAIGVVRVACSNVFGVERLPVIFADFRTSFPAITIELSASNRLENILQREADIAVRMTTPAQDALVARKVAPTEIGFFAAPALAMTMEGVTDYEVLSDRYAFVGGDRSDAVGTGLASKGLSLPKNVAYRSDNDLAQLAAIRAGIGFGVCQVAAAKSTGLVRLLPELSFMLDTWVVMHKDLKGITRVRRVFDHIVAALS